ncbi:hypothetical protein EDF46_2675 [Frondihabitans sp. PhB188]|uniref:DUF7882 family protein n=1 Tax=Frondihabitans sp. PhB188 TaxID=2485200 RepID=UPI000F47482F|nr:hypothetical protein [Frondihabitans sp. PhB188]ROQ37221.1 hypothetical protein EDF46_2675 [Frondihabitans sp. PhB188]
MSQLRTMPLSQGSGRASIWVSDAIPLYFRYETASVPIKRRWLEQLTLRANSNSGLVVTPELEDNASTSRAVTHLEMASR